MPAPGPPGARPPRGEGVNGVAPLPLEGAARCAGLRALPRAAPAAACLLLAACGAAAAAGRAAAPRPRLRGAPPEAVQLAAGLGEGVVGEGATERWQLRGIGSGCSNWASAMFGEVTTVTDADECGRRCARAEGCVGFGYQHGSSPDWRLGRNVSGGCALWKGPCVEEANPYWDDYEMVAGGPALPSAPPAVPSAAEPRKAMDLEPGVAAGGGRVVQTSIDIENLDLETLRQHHGLYKSFVLTLKRELARKMGVGPDDVDLDLAEGHASGVLR